LGEKPSKINAIVLTLNQRVAGSSPAGPTRNQRLTGRSGKSPNNYPHSVRKIGPRRTRFTGGRKNEKIRFSPTRQEAARIRTLTAIRDKLRPPPVREPLPPLKAYARPPTSRVKAAPGPPMTPGGDVA
jgi:hypothetical protein